MFVSRLTSFLATAALASATLVAGTLVSAQKADAATSTCYETTKYDTVCIHSVRWNHSNPNIRRVASTVNGGHYSVTTVTCNPAHRYNYKQNLAGISCFQFD